MPQLLKRIKNTNTKSPAYGKYYVTPVYPEKFIGTKELADFIQSQATVKRSDCIAVLDELGSALHHFLTLGQKVKLENIGIFKVGVSSAGSNTAALCTALPARGDLDAEGGEDFGEDRSPVPGIHPRGHHAEGCLLRDCSRCR